MCLKMCIKWIRKLCVFFLMGQVSLMAAPQAVIFDFGGVLNLEANHDAVAQFIQERFHISPTEFATAAQEKHLWSKLGMTEEEFWSNYAYRKKIVLPPDWKDSLQLLLQKAVGADPEMYRLIDQLKERGLRVGLLSNVDMGRAKTLRQFGFYAPFDPCILSSEVGLEKPDPKIYLLLLSTLHLPAHDVIFIDDKASNIEAANKLGIDGIVFESKEQLTRELDKRINITTRARARSS